METRLSKMEVNLESVALKYGEVPMTSFYLRQLNFVCLQAGVAACKKGFGLPGLFEDELGDEPPAETVEVAGLPLLPNSNAKWSNPSEVKRRFPPRGNKSKMGSNDEALLEQARLQGFGGASPSAALA